MVIIACQVQALENGIGDFDIDKVRSAVQNNNDTGVVGAELQHQEPQRITTAVLRIILYLGIVIALIVVIAWFVRKKNMHIARGGSGAMDIVEVLPLGPNRLMVMLRVMDEIYLIAQTTSTVSLIDKIAGQKAMDIIASAKGGGVVSFRDAFNSFMGKIKKPL